MSEIDTWTLVEEPFDVRYNRHYEGLMAIGSGPLQQRASLEEGLHNDPQDLEFLRVMGNVTVEAFPDFKSRVGTYLPGVSGPHPTCRDQMINLPMLHQLKIYIAGERLHMESPRVSDYRRRLDLRTGRLHRQFRWETRSGARLHFRFERFISAARHHLMALRCTVHHEIGPAVEVRFLGSLSAEVRTNGFDHFTAVEITGQHEPITLAVRTNSGIDVGAAATLTSDRPVPWRVETEARWVALSGAVTLGAGERVQVEKLATLTSSRHVRPNPVDAARSLVWNAAAAGYPRLAEESDAVWAERWDRTDVELDGDPVSQLALRTSLYHMLRAVVENDPRCAIDAKGAAGEAYCGRYFWDTDIFMLPLFLYTRPAVGRTLARFRVHSLPGARRNAQHSGYSGAKYAWESAPTGDEHCPNWQYADHEVHVTADAAYGLWHAHLTNPEDVAFLRDTAEVLIETARYWCERVRYNPQRGVYEMLLVMGPDEYTPFSRNNAYTNRLAALALSLASFAFDKLARTDAAAAQQLAEGLVLQDGELARFDDVAARLHIPYDADRRLVLQSDDFFDYEPLDFDRWWPDRTKRIGACVSQERLYRSQVLKQADVIQLMAMFPHEFDGQQMRIAYETYEPLTSHDSSLSRSMHAIVASWLGRDEEAWRLWRQTVGLDLELGEAAEGIHAACAGANWQVVVFGFAGVRSRMQSEILHVAPRLPAAWTSLRFPFVWENQPLRITIERDRVLVRHEGDRPLDAFLAGRHQTLKPGEETEVGMGKATSP